MTLYPKMNMLSLCWLAISMAVCWSGHSLVLLFFSGQVLINVFDYQSQFPMLAIIGCVSGAIFGSLTGLSQSIVLSSAVQRAKWVAATSASWAVGGLIYWNLWFELWFQRFRDTPLKEQGAYWWIPWLFQVPLLLSWMLPVLFQWWILRRIVPRASWWLVITALGWYVATFVSWNFYEYIFMTDPSLSTQAICLLAGGLFLGVFTAFGLYVLLAQRTTISVLYLWYVATPLAWVVALIPASLMSFGLYSPNSMATTVSSAFWYHLDFVQSIIFYTLWGGVVGILAALTLSRAQAAILETLTGQGNWLLPTMLSVVIASSIGGAGIVLLVWQEHSPNGEFGLWVVSWIVLGTIVGSVMSLFQLPRIRRCSNRPLLWILANGLSWGLGIGVFWITYRFLGGPLGDPSPYLLNAEVHARWFTGLLAGSILGGLCTGLLSSLVLPFMRFMSIDKSATLTTTITT